MNKKTRLSSFTFQYVSINTKEPAKDMGEICTLHSNMFLLIRMSMLTTGAISIDFTFQYVSINTRTRYGKSYLQWLFTFQYVSINTGGVPCGRTIEIFFTFQYVSINTFARSYSPAFRSALHSNMFLLILVLRQKVGRARQSLHSNMFLLIHYGI